MEQFPIHHFESKYAFPAEPVSKKLEDFIGAYPDGIILVDYREADIGPGKHVYPAFWCKNHTTYGCIIGRTDGDFWSAYDTTAIPNVLILPHAEIPYPALMQRKEVKIVLGHGTFQQVTDSIYYAKPMIISPLWFDNLSLAYRMKRKNLAYIMPQMQE